MKVAPEEAWSRFTSASVSTEEPLESFLCIKRTVASLVVYRLDVVPVPGSYGSYCGTRRDGQALDRNNITKELDCVGGFERNNLMYLQQSHGTWRGYCCGLLELYDVRCLGTNHGEDLSTQEHVCLNGLEGLMAERELLELDESDELDELGIVGA